MELKTETMEKKGEINVDLKEVKRQWDNYNEEFDNSDYMDIDTHTSMAMKVGQLIDRIERLEKGIRNTVKYMEDNSGTVDKPLRLTQEQVFNVYEGLKLTLK